MCDAQFDGNGSGTSKIGGDVAPFEIDMDPAVHSLRSRTDVEPQRLAGFECDADLFGLDCFDPWGEALPEPGRCRNEIVEFADHRRRGIRVQRHIGDDAACCSAQLDAGLLDALSCRISQVLGSGPVLEGDDLVHPLVGRLGQAMSTNS